MVRGYGPNPWLRLGVAAGLGTALVAGIIIGVNLIGPTSPTSPTGPPAWSPTTPGPANQGLPAGPVDDPWGAPATPPASGPGPDGAGWPTWTSPAPPSPSPSADHLIASTPFEGGEVNGVYHFQGQMWPPAVDVSPGPVEVEWLRPPVTDRLSAAQAGVCDTMIRLFTIDPEITTTVTGMVLRAGWGLGQDFAAELIWKLPTKVQLDNWFNDGARVRVSECLADGWLFDALPSPHDSRWRGTVTVYVDVSTDGDLYAWTEQIIIPDLFAAQADQTGETVTQTGDWRLIGAPRW